MLSDLDPLLTSRGLSAALVPMHELNHADFRWLTRGAKVTRGYAVKVIGREPVLVTYPMEREEAAATGVAVRLVDDFDYNRIFRSAASPAEGYAEFFDRMLRDLGAHDAIGVFGSAPVHLWLDVADRLAARGWVLHRGGGEDLIQLARKRKDQWEIDAIRSAGERTEQVVDGVREILRGAVIENDRLLRDGRTLTLGDLKQFVSLEIARLGMVEDHDTILSQGRDAGVPHSRGDAAAPVRPSVPLVLDIFPSDRATGYFFDLTRTFCAGPIPDELRRIHTDVYVAFTTARDAMRAGTEASSYQALVCDFFESRGYATTRSDPATLSGYVHSLGHGVGLDVHERPFFGLASSNKDLVEVGDIVTIEPGLYFPDRELGVRIEDTFVVRDDGTVETLCRGDYGLEP